MDQAPATIERMQIRTITTATREYAAVVVSLGGLQLSADLVNDRQIRQAHRLAESHGIVVGVSPELRARVEDAVRVRHG